MLFLRAKFSEFYHNSAVNYTHMTFNNGYGYYHGKIEVKYGVK